MKIMVINPNTSQAMTRSIEAALMPIKRADTALTVVCAEHGPETIECAYDEAMAVPHVLARVRQANTQEFDACVLACFSDPGLVASREISDIPVIGIEESSLHLAAMLGGPFVIVTPRKQRIYTKRHEAHVLGQTHQLGAVVSLEMSVAETEADPVGTQRKVITVARRAAEEHQAEVIILGCAGMAGYAGAVEAATGMRVLDPSAVGLKMAEMCVDLGVVHAKCGFYATPPAKTFL